MNWNDEGIIESTLAVNDGNTSTTNKPSPLKVILVLLVIFALVWSTGIFSPNTKASPEQAEAETSPTATVINEDSLPTPIPTLEADLFADLAGNTKAGQEVPLTLTINGIRRHISVVATAETASENDGYSLAYQSS